MFKKIIFTGFFIFVFSQGVIFPEGECFVNPGVKLGYRFGDGFVFGMEVSFTWVSNRGIFGAVLAYDHCSNTNLTKYNFSVEWGGVAGIAAGPSLIVSDTSKSYGVTTTIYGGILIMPYINCDFNFKEKSRFETGSYIKIPIKTGGPSFKLQ